MQIKRDLGITATLFGGDGWASAQLMEMAKDAVQGSYILNHLDFADPIKPNWCLYGKIRNKTELLRYYLANDAFLVLKAAIGKAVWSNLQKVDALTQVEVTGAAEQLSWTLVTGKPDERSSYR